MRLNVTLFERFLLLRTVQTPGGTYSNYLTSFTWGPKISQAFRYRVSDQGISDGIYERRMVLTASFPCELAAVATKGPISTITVHEMCERTNLMASCHNVPFFVSDVGLVWPLRTNI